MGKRCSDHTSVHAPLSKLPSQAWKCAPSGYAWVWGIAQSLPFSQVLAPLVPATRVLFVYSHSFRASPHSESQLLHQTYSLEQWHLFPGGPFPSHTESLPLGVPCPWGLPCHLSELSLFCIPQKIENPRRQGLFGHFCTN